VLIASTSTVSLLMIYCVSYDKVVDGSYMANKLAELCMPILVSALLICTIIVMLRIFRRAINSFSKMLMGAILLCGILPLLFVSQLFFIFEIAIAMCFYIYYIVTSWTTLKGAQWAIVAGSFSTMVFGLVFSFVIMFPQFSNSYIISNLLGSAIYLSLPLSLLVYVSMRFKEIIQEVREHSQQIIQLSEEKRQQALNQQKLLQEEVDRQTAELRHTLEDLKATQAQLIQSEKMASLGQLTAGIAHEIQNPLNFVNNFSEINTELIEELKNELVANNREEALLIADDIKDNEQKIIHHGKRADSIVKGMLQHSRASTGKKELTNINALVDECLRLSYHGMRAKDKEFNAAIKTELDESIGKINVVPQDISRVLLNLLNNAFYAVEEKKRQLNGTYEPTVSMCTKKLDNKVEIHVKDNGNGIPQNIVDKIFQPFFTTKPTGQGTGLGLSLSYDIIKAHGGEIKVESNGEEGKQFTIQLPTTYS
jgi:signal transduction histidine kinase